MGIHVMRTASACIFMLPIASHSATTCPNPADIIAAQNAATDTHITNINSAAKTVLDSIVSTPQTAKDAGCLDGILGLDLQLFAVDITNIWGPLYNQFKQQLLSQACSAATDYVNAQTAQLTGKLSGTLGGITITRGTAITDWQSVVRSDVNLSSAALTNLISTGTLGEVPPSVGSTRTASRVTTNEESEVVDKISPFEDIKSVINSIDFWSN